MTTINIPREVTLYPIALFLPSDAVQAARPSAPHHSQDAALLRMEGTLLSAGHFERALH